jgi:hypothetical protein
MCCGVGGRVIISKTKKIPQKELKTGDIKLPMFLCCKCVNEINPLKITKWAI